MEARNSRQSVTGMRVLWFPLAGTTCDCVCDSLLALTSRRLRRLILRLLRLLLLLVAHPPSQRRSLRVSPRRRPSQCLRGTHNLCFRVRVSTLRCERRAWNGKREPENRQSRAARLLRRITSAFGTSDVRIGTLVFIARMNTLDELFAGLLKAFFQRFIGR